MKAKLIVIILIWICFFEDHVQAQLSLPGIFSNNMVLQREMNTPIWGTSAPDNIVTVQIAGFRVSSTADADGKWMARLPFIKAGGPYELIVSDKKETSVFKNVLFGDVR